MVHKLSCPRGGRCADAIAHRCRKSITSPSETQFRRKLAPRLPVRIRDNQEYTKHSSTPATKNKPWKPCFGGREAPRKRKRSSSHAAAYLRRQYLGSNTTDTTTDVKAGKCKNFAIVEQKKQVDVLLYHDWELGARQLMQASSAKHSCILVISGNILNGWLSPSADRLRTRPSSGYCSPICLL